MGKTYLVNETFKGEITFRHAGLSPIEMSEVHGGSPLRKQLKHFYNSLLLQGMKRSRRVRLSRYDIVQAYMITGGIPYYMNYFGRGLSLAQNVDRMFFAAGAPLRNEHSRLFASVFNNPDMIA